MTKKIICYDIDDAESVGIKFYKRNEGYYESNK